MELRTGRDRTVIVGDVHGCRRELEWLLELVRFGTGDRLVFVGDLVARGPDSLGVLALARAKGAVLVRGNHEERVLRERAATARGAEAAAKPHRALAEALRPADWVLLETSPLTLALPEHGLTVLHGGVDPTRALDDQDASTLLNARHARDAAGNKVLWGEAYGGPEQLVFGHNAIEKLQLHPFATGLDTGCVYGGRLTALVLEAGERLPADLDERRARLVSVPAERVWFEPGTAERGKGES